MRLQRCAWSESAQAGLARTFYTENGFNGLDHVRRGVLSGDMELWLVDGHSWAITQTWQESQFVWCYQGRDVREFAACMYTVAQRNGLKSVRFATKHKGLPRMLRAFRCESVAPEVFEIKVH